MTDLVIRPLVAGEENLPLAWLTGPAGDWRIALYDGEPERTGFRQLRSRVVFEPASLPPGSAVTPGAAVAA